MFLLQLFFLLLKTSICLFSDTEIYNGKENHEIVKRHVSSPAYGYTNVYIEYAKKNIKVRKHEGKPDVYKYEIKTLFHQVGLSH